MTVCNTIHLLKVTVTKCIAFVKYELLIEAIIIMNQFYHILS